MRYQIEKTDVFDSWLKNLKKRQAVLAISLHLTPILVGNFGDAKPGGSGVYEFRLFTGPGYRVYYTMKGSAVVLLPIGGEKSTQERDIEKAKKIAKTMR